MLQTSLQVLPENNQDDTVVRLYLQSRYLHSSLISHAQLMHQSFVATAPPHTPGEVLGFNIRILTLGRFSIAKGRAKSNVLTSSLPPGGEAHSRAMKAEKS